MLWIENAVYHMSVIKTSTRYRVLQPIGKIVSACYLSALGPFWCNLDVSVVSLHGRLYPKKQRDVERCDWVPGCRPTLHHWSLETGKYTLWRYICSHMDLGGILYKMGRSHLGRSCIFLSIIQSDINLQKILYITIKPRHQCWHSPQLLP